MGNMSLPNCVGYIVVSLLSAGKQSYNAHISFRIQEIRETHRNVGRVMGSYFRFPPLGKADHYH